MISAWCIAIHPILASAETGIVDVLVWVVFACIWVIAQVSALKKKNRSSSSHSKSDTAETPYQAPDDQVAAFLQKLSEQTGVSPRAEPKTPTQKRHKPLPAKSNALPRRHSHTAEMKARFHPKVNAPLFRTRTKAVTNAPSQVPSNISEFGYTEEDVPQWTSWNRKEAHIPSLDLSMHHHSSITLPQLHSMDCRLTPLPRIPLPAFASDQRNYPAIRPALRDRKSLRRAIVAQTILQPPVSLQS